MCVCEIHAFDKILGSAVWAIDTVCMQIKEQFKYLGQNQTKDKPALGICTTSRD